MTTTFAYLDFFSTPGLRAIRAAKSPAMMRGCGLGERPQGHSTVNEIVRAAGLLAHAQAIADGIAALPPLTGRHTRIAVTQRLRRLVEEGPGCGLALEGISAVAVACAAAAG